MVQDHNAGQLPERQHEQALARTVPARAVDTEWRALCVEPHGLEHGPAGGDRHDEFTTPDFFGALQGDPPEGWQDACLHNNHGRYTMFFLGTQEEEGRPFRDDTEIDGAIVALENCRGT